MKLVSCASLFHFLCKQSYKLQRNKFLGIRYSEELSLKRFIPPELLRRGLGFESDQAGLQQLPYVEVGLANFLLLSSVFFKD